MFHPDSTLAELMQNLTYIQAEGIATPRLIASELCPYPGTRDFVTLGRRGLIDYDGIDVRVRYVQPDVQRVRDACMSLADEYFAELEREANRWDILRSRFFVRGLRREVARCALQMRRVRAFPALVLDTIIRRSSYGDRSPIIIDDLSRRLRVLIGESAAERAGVYARLGADDGDDKRSWAEPASAHSSRSGGER